MQMSDLKSGLPDGAPAILHVARAGDLAALQAILADDPAAIHKTDINEICAIHIAAGHGHLAFVQALLAAGSNPDARSSDGFSPLALAAMSEQCPSGTRC